MRNAILNQFCVWLEDTPISQFIQGSEWIVPLTQLVHIFAVSAALSVALMMGLRLLGYFANEQPFASTFNKCWPIFRLSLWVLLFTGSVLMVGEPSKSLANSSFQIKMLLLACVLTISHMIKNRLVNPVTDWRSGYAPERALQLEGKVLSTILLVLLVCVVFAGRLIAYT